MPRAKLTEQPPEERRVPFGHDKGTRLRDAPTKNLESLRRWCREKEDESADADFGDLITAIDEELSERQGLELGL